MICFEVPNPTDAPTTEDAVAGMRYFEPAVAMPFVAQAVGAVRAREKVNPLFQRLLHDKGAPMLDCIYVCKNCLQTDATRQREHLIRFHDGRGRPEQTDIYECPLRVRKYTWDQLSQRIHDAERALDIRNAIPTTVDMLNVNASNSEDVIDPNDDNPLFNWASDYPETYALHYPRLPAEIQAANINTFIINSFKKTRTLRRYLACTSFEQIRDFLRTEHVFEGRTYSALNSIDKFRRWYRRSVNPPVVWFLRYYGHILKHTAFMVSLQPADITAERDRPFLSEFASKMECWYEHCFCTSLVHVLSDGLTLNFTGKGFWDLSKCKPNTHYIFQIVWIRGVSPFRCLDHVFMLFLTHT
jgi:hypothetical protein